VSLFKKPEPGGEEWVDITANVRSTAPDSPIVPDSATPVYGFRLWTIERVMAKLIGTYAAWIPGRNVAECGTERTVGSWGALTITSAGTATAEKTHAAPDPNCRCGFNALDAWEQLEIKAGHYGEPMTVQSYGGTAGYSTMHTPWVEGNVEDIFYPQVPGVAKGWGRVAIHTGGWRSQYAEIVALIDLCAVLPWFDRDERYHKILEYSAKHYGVPILDRIPDLREFE
jgi:hypothetical protein